MCTSTPISSSSSIKAFRFSVDQLAFLLEKLMYTSSMEDRRTQLKKLLRSGRTATPQQRFSTVRLCMARYAPGLPAADAATKASAFRIVTPSTRLVQSSCSDCTNCSARSGVVTTPTSVALRELEKLLVSTRLST